MKRGDRPPGAPSSWRLVVRRRIRHPLEYGFFRAFQGLVRALPHRASRWLGAGLGTLGYYVDFRHRWVANNNLELIMPELSPPERHRLVRRCFRHFGGVLCDSLSLGRFDAEEICELVTLEGWEHLQAAERPGRPLFLLGAHLGNWEIAGSALALFHGKTHVIARTPDNVRLDRILRHLRERFGNATIPKRGGVRQMLRTCREGGRIAILADQRVHPHEGVEVPFFGQPAMTTPLVAELSLRYDAPVVPVFGHPLPGGRFKVVARPAIEPEGKGQEALENLTARYMAVIEQEAREQPETWLWMHERWIWLDHHKRWRKWRSKTFK